MAQEPDPSYDSALHLIGARATADVRRGIGDDRGVRYAAAAALPAAAGRDADADASLPGAVAAPAASAAAASTVASSSPSTTMLLTATATRTTAAETTFGDATRELERLRKYYVRSQFDYLTAETSLEHPGRGVGEHFVQSLFAELASLVRGIDAEPARRRLGSPTEQAEERDEARASLRSQRDGYFRERQVVSDLAHQLRVPHPDCRIRCMPIEFPSQNPHCERPTRSVVVDASSPDEPPQAQIASALPDESSQMAAVEPGVAEAKRYESPQLIGDGISSDEDNQPLQLTTDKPRQLTTSSALPAEPGTKPGTKEGKRPAKRQIVDDDVSSDEDDDGHRPKGRLGKSRVNHARNKRGKQASKDMSEAGVVGGLRSRKK